MMPEWKNRTGLLVGIGAVPSVGWLDGSGVGFLAGPGVG